MIWIPVIEFENMIKFEKNVNYGRATEFVLWHVGDNSWEGGNMLYMEKLHLTVSCLFYFDKFPFDSHTCYLELGSLDENMTLKSSLIIYGNTQTRVGNGPIILSDSPLPYEFKLMSLPTSHIPKYDHGTYPLTGMIIKMKRKSLGLLLGGYYYPTTAFALLSMISFLINPDIVSEYLCV